MGNEERLELGPDCSVYLPVIDAHPRKILFWAFLTLLSKCYELLAILLGSRSTHNLISNLLLIYACLYGSVTFLIVPLYQNVRFSVAGSDSLSSRSVLSYIFKCKCSVIQWTDGPTDNDTRFIPFSTYNYYFMLTNSGKELNPKLPKDLKYFGGLRAYLLFQQCMLYGVLKALLLASAIYITVVEDHTAYSYCIAALSLLGAVVGLETTFVAFAFWVYGLPYFATTLAYPVASALCPHQTDQIVNPINGSTSYVILERAWDRAAWL